MGNHYQCICLYSNTCKTECPHGSLHAYWEEECHGYPYCVLDKSVSCSVIRVNADGAIHIGKTLEVRQ
jgi:hypothetical protein